MKLSFRTAMALCAIAALLACAPKPPAPTDAAKPVADDNQALIAAADALDDAFLKAYNAGDAAAITALYANGPDTVSFPPGQLEHRGIEAIKAGWAKAFEKGPMGKLELTEAFQIPAGDHVIGWGLWKWTMAMPDGTEMVQVGRYTDVKVKRDGKWVYILDHASAPMPMPEMPAAPAPKKK